MRPGILTGYETVDWRIVFLRPRVAGLVHRFRGQAVRLAMTRDDANRRTEVRLSGGGNI